MIRRTSRRTIESSASASSASYSPLLLKSHLGVGFSNNHKSQQINAKRLARRRHNHSVYLTIQTLIIGIVVFAILLIVTFIIIQHNFQRNHIGSFDGDGWIVQQWFNRWTITTFDEDDNYDNNSNNDTGIIFRKTKDEHPYTIFYNIYIPPNNVTASADAIGIVKEQLLQVARSVATRHSLIIHYNIIGDPDPLLKENKLNQYCKSLHTNLSCSILDVYESATEEVTLRKVHEFCIQNPNYRVSYIHSKGSYHASVKNTHWRRALTDAAVADGCINPPGDTCNLCGIQFFTQFTFFIPGNMFTAHCDYIRKLLPFNEYKTKREEAVMNVLIMRLRNQLKATLIWDQRDFYGLDRYSDEHWVGSHPDIIPCDMDPIGSLEHVFQGITTNKDFTWGMGPRNLGVCGGISDQLQSVVSTDVSLRQREIQLLPGNLVKWYTLYNQPPGQNSWVWDFFPDGSMWKQAVNAHGKDAVDLMTQKYTYSLDGSSLRTSFAPVEEFNRTIFFSSEEFTEELPVVSSTSLRAIFYHIAFSDGPDSEESRYIVEQQLQLIHNSYAVNYGNHPKPFYYTFAGTDSLYSMSEERTFARLIEDFCNNSTNVICRQLPSLTKNYEGETIRHLYSYCQANPSHKVSYIHNQGPVQLRYEGGNEKLIRHMTMAVTSEECINSLDESCNVCGLMFYMLWTFFYPGNMFVASCSYVTRLISPPDFEALMIDYVKLALLSRIRLKLQTNIFPDRIDYFGLDRHAIDFWIGSHPTLKPCDLSGNVYGRVSSRNISQQGSTPDPIEPSNRQNLHRKASNAFVYWRSVDRTATHFQLEITPSRLEGPFGYNATKKYAVFRNESLLRREFYLLAGHVQRWLYLYDDMPSADSWIWKKMPEGRIWLNGYEEYGTDVIDQLTEEYAVDNL